MAKETTPAAPMPSAAYQTRRFFIRAAIVDRVPLQALRLPDVLIDNIPWFSENPGQLVNRGTLHDLRDDMNGSIAYLAQGQLYVKEGASEAKPFKSRFAEEVKERALQIQRRHDWKTEGRGAQFMRGGALWGGDLNDPAAMRIAITSISAGTAEGHVLYTLEAGPVTGILALRPADGSEVRLRHGNDLAVGQIAGSRAGGGIAGSLRQQANVANICVMNSEAGDLREVTGGDSLDCSPCWVEDSGERIVYQSAGIGRDAAGNFAALGCYAIQELNLRTGEVREIAGSPDHDLLGPRMLSDGTLYFIRRPKSAPRLHNLLGVLRDTLLFPFRLLVAIFHYLNFFSARYTGKPLTTAGGPGREGPDSRGLVIWGNLLNAQKAARGGARPGEDPPPLAPRSWELVRQRPGGEAESIAKHVLSFDCRPGGSVVYSTGTGIYSLAPSGERARIATAFGIEQVICLR